MRSVVTRQWRIRHRNCWHGDEEHQDTSDDARHGMFSRGETRQSAAAEYVTLRRCCCLAAMLLPKTRQVSSNTARHHVYGYSSFIETPLSPFGFEMSFTTTRLICRYHEHACRCRRRLHRQERVIGQHVGLLVGEDDRKASVGTFVMVAEPSSIVVVSRMSRTHVRLPY